MYKSISIRVNFIYTNRKLLTCAVSRYPRTILRAGESRTTGYARYTDTSLHRSETSINNNDDNKTTDFNCIQQQQREKEKFQKNAKYDVYTAADIAPVHVSLIHGRTRTRRTCSVRGLRPVYFFMSTNNAVKSVLVVVF